MITCQKFDLRDLNDFLATMWGGRRIKAKPFLYPVNFGVILNGATGKETLTIAGDSDFVFLSSFVLTRDALSDAASACPASTLLITDSGTNEKYMDSRALVANYCNDIGNPAAFKSFIALPIPRRIPKQTTLSLSFTNNSGIDPGSIVVVLEGLRVWEYSQ